MKLINSQMNFQIVTEEGYVNSLVIENRDFFRSAIQDIYDQINGREGSFVLSENNKIMDFSKSTELITQFVPFEINSKRLITKLYNNIKTAVMEPELYREMYEIKSNVCRYMDSIVNELDFNIKYNEDFDVTALLKVMDMRFEDEYDTLSDKVMEYIMNVEKLEGSKLHILVNFRGYVNRREVECFCETMIKHNINILLIDNVEYDKFNFEKRIIVDEQLCEIY